MNNIHGLSGARSGGRGGGGGGGGGGSSTPGCMDQMKSSWAGVPLFNKWITTTLTVLMLVGFFLPVNAFIALIPGYLLTFQIWRIFTGTFAVNGLLNWIFSIMSFVPSATIEENNMGTVPFAIRFLKLSTFINLVHSAISLVVGLTVYPPVLGQDSFGIWPIIFCDMVIQCYQAPEMPRNLCCLPIQVKSKYYPVILLLLFCLIFQTFQFALFTGTGCGYLWVFGYLKFLETSPQGLREYEEWWPFSSYKNDRSYRASSSALINVPPRAASQSGGGMLSSFMGGGNSSQTSTQAAPGSSPAPEETKTGGGESFKAFKGNGAKLGSDLSSSSSIIPSSLTRSSTKTEEEKRQERLANLPISQNVNQELGETQFSDSDGDEEMKSGDGQGGYKPINQNAGYQME